MAAETTKSGSDTGMSLGTLKKMLARSRKEPTHCALAQGSSETGGRGLVLMDKIKPAKQILRDLKKRFPDLRNPCFGLAVIDANVSPKLVTFKMNKRVPGLDRKIKRSLRGTGFTQVIIEPKAQTPDG